MNSLSVCQTCFCFSGFCKYERPRSSGFGYQQWLLLCLQYMQSTNLNPPEAHSSNLLLGLVFNKAANKFTTSLQIACTSMCSCGTVCVWSGGREGRVGGGEGGKLV